MQLNIIGFTIYSLKPLNKALYFAHVGFKRHSRVFKRMFQHYQHRGNIMDKILKLITFFKKTYPSKTIVLEGYVYSPIAIFAYTVLTILS